MKVDEEIERAKREMETVKPRSRRRTELELRLRDLRLHQLRDEATIGNSNNEAQHSMRYSFNAWDVFDLATDVLRAPSAKPKSIETGIR